MPRTNEILNELEQLSMVVAGISRQLPYEAPAGYFSEFPDKMLALPKLDALKEAPSPDWGKSPVMSVPEGYFEGFASRMMEKIHAGNVLTGRPEVHPEEAPAGEVSPLLSRIGKIMPYQVPEGYFDSSLPSATLLALKDKPVYEVPEGYFETLAAIVMARVQPAGAATGKVVSMAGRRRTSWLKYAAAAVITGALLTFGWLRLQTHSKDQPAVASVNVPEGLTKVSDQDLQNYEDTHRVHEVEPEEEYANSTASLDITDNDAKSLLGDVPDGELAQYMEEHGDLKDYPTN